VRPKDEVAAGTDSGNGTGPHLPPGIAPVLPGIQMDAGF
jgi:hypothetical protein